MYTHIYRGTSEQAIGLPSLREIVAYPIKTLWRSVQADRSLMHALKRKCAAGTVDMAQLFGTDATDFRDMQQQARRDIATENELRSRETIQWTTQHDKQLDIVMKDITERDLYVEGSRNKHWWRQIAANMSSAMKHPITISTLKRHAKLLDCHRAYLCVSANGVPCCRI